MKFTCPHCSAPLNISERILTCINNHSFDIAKEGYVNLLNVQRKSTKQPGDDAGMIDARRSFLGKGFYAPMVEGIESVFKKHTSLLNSNITRDSSGVPSFLDLGCGEGYYTRLMRDKYVFDIQGVDISKHAIKHAAKHFVKNNTVNAQYAVASAFELPLPDKSMDAVLRVFAPSLSAEVLRVLKDDGVFLTATPGSNHLMQLRELIYSDVQEHKQEDTKLDGFSLLDDVNIRHTLDLNVSDRKDLLCMTPFSWKATDLFNESYYSGELFSVDVDFRLQLYKRS